MSIAGEHEIGDFRVKYTGNPKGRQMKQLIPLIREIEIELRSNNGQLQSKEIWNKLSKLSDWDYRIVQDAMLRVRLWMNQGDDNFVFKYYETLTKPISLRKTKNLDLVIAVLKRDQQDLCLTDAWNRLVIPSNVKHQVIEIWGLEVVKARNFAVEQTLKMGADYLLFIDDDIIAPNNALMKLWNLMAEKEALVTSGLYFKKVEPLEAPFEDIKGEIALETNTRGKKLKQIPLIQECSKMIGMGFSLLNIREITSKIPLPLFHAFGSPDGYWSLGEDAFFVQNLVEYTCKIPLVDTSIKCLHMDKTWKKVYGNRDNEVVYATGIWDTNDVKSFERMRVPPKYPLILICIPGRDKKEPVAVDLDNMLLHRGYRSELFRPIGLEVDEARNVCGEEALKRNADYLLFIDNDVIPPKDGANNLIEKMEKVEEPCAISGVYWLKGTLSSGTAHTQLDSKTGMVTDLNRTEIYKKSKPFYKSDWLIGLGFCLIDIYCFKSMRRPFFKCYAKGKDNNINEDAHFCELMAENGFKIYIDQDIQCLHADFDNKVTYGEYDKNIEYAGFKEILTTFEIFNTENVKKKNKSKFKKVKKYAL